MHLFKVAEQDSDKEIDAVKNKIVDNSLIVGSILGLFSFIASLKFNLQNDYIFFIFSDLSVVVSFIVISIIRKRLHIEIKSLIILVGLFLLALGSIYKVGVFADSKILIILVPLFAFLGFSLRNTIIIYAVAMFSFIILGYLYISGIIESAVDLSQRALSISVWVNNVLLISIISFVIIIIVIKFNKTFLNLINDLKNKNSELEEYRNSLEQLVEERTEELEKANDKLMLSNNELEKTVEKLQNSQDNLFQAEKMASLGLLASGVAHEINNPLNFIQGGITGIEMFFEDNLNKRQIDEIAPFLDGMKEGVMRAAKIVTSLGHFSRNDYSSIQKCDIHAIIDNCLVMLNNKLKHKVEVRKNYTKSKINLQCNDGKLHQVVLNILANAEQSISIKGIIDINTSIDDSNIIIIIKDNGHGIKQEIISKISEPFFTTKEVGKGTGLGLSIAYKIIEENKGTIKHLSKEGEGTTVIITMPNIV